MIKKIAILLITTFALIGNVNGSSDGELRQYSVKLDGSTKLVQLEDVLVAGGEEATWNQSRGNQS